jgi:hypothetical protein
VYRGARKVLLLRDGDEGADVTNLDIHKRAQSILQLIVFVVKARRDQYLPACH